MDNGKTICKMDGEFIYGLNPKEKDLNIYVIDTKENGKMVKEVVLAYFIMQMVQNTLDNGKII